MAAVPWLQPGAASNRAAVGSATASADLARARDVSGQSDAANPGTGAEGGGVSGATSAEQLAAKATSATDYADPLEESRQHRM